MFEPEEVKMIEEGKMNRRDFVKYGGYGLGGVLAASTIANLGLGTIVTAQPPEDTPVAEEGPAQKPVIPDEIKARIDAALPKVDWPLTGAQVFAKACVADNLAAQFICPGNYTVIHALADEGVLTISGRHEAGTAHAADGFTRCSGEISLCSGTEGPGFTNMITGIASANAARTPMLAVASNMSMQNDETEASIQDMQQQPTTQGIKKYGKRLINPARIMEYTGYAFREALSGETGVVHLDFPSEVHAASFDGPGEQVRSWGPDEYRPHHRPYPSPQAIKEAVKLLTQAQRPIIVASVGVFYKKAWEPLIRLAEKAEIPVVQSGPTMGHFPNDHALSACLSHKAYPKADLIVYVGQYCMPPDDERGFGTPTTHYFDPAAKRIVVGPTAERIGRNVPAAVGIISDEKTALEALVEEMPSMNRTGWLSELAAAREEFEKELDGIYQNYQNFTEAVHPSVIGKDLSDFLYKGDIPKEQTTMVVGGFGINFYMIRWWRNYRPGQTVMAPYQFGAIGCEYGFALGVGAAVKEGVGVQKQYKGAPVVCVGSDAGFGITGFEIETMAKYKLPIILIVYNNNAWGTFTGVYKDPVKEHIHLFQENLRYDKVAEALGAHGEYVTNPHQFLPALRRCYRIAEKENIPSVINVQGKREFWLADQYPPGFLGIIQPGIMTVSH